MGTTVAQLQAEITAKGAGSAVNKINQVGIAGTSAANKISEGNERTGRSYSRMIKNAAVVVAGLYTIKKAADIAFASVTKSKDFEAAISDLSAITGATGKDLAFLANQSKEFGRTTTLSATQAAEAFKLIASAKPDLLENAAALSAVTKEAIILAEAAGSTLPEAAETLGSSLNQFGADADEANRFINVLAAGAKFGASEIADTANALRDSGTVAASANVSFEELNAGIQTLSTVSIKGSRAGVGLRNVILKLQKEGIDNLNPAVVGLTGALQNLSAQGLETTELIEIFGLENVTAAKALIANADSMETLTRKLTDTNTAYDQAAIKVDNLDGEFKQLNSAIEATLIDIGDKLNPVLRAASRELTNLLNSFSEDEKAIRLFNEQLLPSKSLIEDLGISFQNIESDNLSDVNRVLDAIKANGIDLVKEAPFIKLSDSISVLINKGRSLEARLEGLKGSSIGLNSARKTLTEQLTLNEQKIADVTIRMSELRTVQDSLSKGKVDLIAPTVTGGGFDEESANQLEALQNSLLDQKGLIEKSYEDRLFIVENSLDEEGISYKQRTDLLIAIEESKNNKLLELDVKDNARQLAKESREQQRLQNSVGYIENSLLTQEQRLEESLERREFMLEDAFQNNVIGLEKKNGLIRQITEKHETDLETLQRSKQQARLSLASGFFSGFAALARSGGEKSFSAYKRLAVAETIISTYAAAQLAYHSQLSLPSPDAPVRANIARAGAIAQGLAAVIAINKTSSSTSSASGGGSGGSGGFGSGSTPTAQQEQRPTSERDRGELTVIFQGEMIGWDEHIQERIIGGIRDLVEDQDVTLISTTSRNGQDLQNTG